MLRAEDLPREQTAKRAKFERYSFQARVFLHKGTITYEEARRKQTFQCDLYVIDIIRDKLLKVVCYEDD